MILSVPSQVERELRLRWRLIEHKNDLVFVAGYVVSDDDLAKTEIKPKWPGQDVAGTQEALAKGTVLMSGDHGSFANGYATAFGRLKGNKRDLMLTVIRPLTHEERAKEVVERLTGGARR